MQLGHKPSHEVYLWTDNTHGEYVITNYTWHTKWTQAINNGKLLCYFSHLSDKIMLTDKFTYESTASTNSNTCRLMLMSGTYRYASRHLLLRSSAECRICMAENNNCSPARARVLQEQQNKDHWVTFQTHQWHDSSPTETACSSWLNYCTMLNFSVTCVAINDSL